MNPNIFKAYRFRILSGLLFLIFLISTWFLFYQKPKYPETLHLSLSGTIKANHSKHSFKTKTIGRKSTISDHKNQSRR